LLHSFKPVLAPRSVYSRTVGSSPRDTQARLKQSSASPAKVVAARCSPGTSRATIRPAPGIVRQFVSANDLRYQRVRCVLNVTGDQERQGTGTDVLADQQGH
jgi:hypothetical protein